MSYVWVIWMPNVTGGYALDYVRVMWMMLQLVTQNDFVIGAGKTHSVRAFCEIAFQYVGLGYRDFVVQDPKFFCGKINRFKRLNCQSLKINNSQPRPLISRLAFYFELQ